ncbi:methyl-accepting chemotaxis protein [Marinomonas sp. 5E14-1]|uniref:methyl-accepting chemotaxis protein n=1 Tax=Marinomonas sp. 5E14-1 TaxID=3153922 RepID=UPI003263AA53
MHRFNLGFKGSLIVSVVLALLLSLSVAALFSYQMIKDQVTQNVTNDLRYLVNEEADSILSVFHRAEEAVTAISKYFTEKGYGPSDYPSVLMTSAKAGGISKLTLGFEDGTSYVSKPSSKTFPGGVGITSKYDPRTRPWYQEGKATSGLSHSKPFFTKSGDPILAVSHTVNNGVLAADVRFSNLQSRLEQISEEGGIKSFITDKSGLIIASTIDAVVPKEDIKSSSMYGFVGELFASENLVAEHVVDGENLLFLVKEMSLINGGQWNFFVAVDRDKVFAPVAKSTAQLLGILSSTAIISVLILLFLLRLIYKPILSLRELITGLSQGNGDLTQRLEVHTNDDIGQIALGINRFIEQLQVMMKEVRNASEQLSGRVVKIHEKSEENSVVLSQHATETEQIVAAVEELSSSAAEVADNSMSAASSANEAKENSSSANERLTQAQAKISTLAEEILQAAENVKKMDNETNNIQSIVEVIGGIAEQTNLLALNASIEAARAGEQGRGFAVVADEVRALANRTQDSTTEIDQALGGLQKEAGSVVIAIAETKNTCETTVEVAESVSQILQTLSGHIIEINNMNAEISSSSSEQSKVIQTISENITELHGMVEKLSTIGNGQHEEVRHISTINDKLGDMISKFKL